MKAYEHTQAMLAWWCGIAMDRVDLAVRRPSGAMLWHRDLVIKSLPLKWARAQNVRHAEVYLRPARQYAWPVVFLDDVATPTARAVAKKYDALVVETSPAGGCHIWLACVRSINEAARRQAQRWLAQRIDADLGSTSGEHLGRLAGFKNWKRGGAWVNVVASSLRGRRWDPSAVPSIASPETAKAPARQRWHKTTDTSPSGKEWGWVCGLLESGCPPEHVYFRLLERACIRRGYDTPRYARRTFQRALERTNRGGTRPQATRDTAIDSEDLRLSRI
jgi:RepB DNA-primase N-terminal domain